MKLAVATNLPATRPLGEGVPTPPSTNINLDYRFSNSKHTTTLQVITYA